MNRLKRCPFCKAVGKVFKDPEYDCWAIEIHHNKECLLYPRITFCWGSDSEENAIKRWNIINEVHCTK